MNRIATLLLVAGALLAALVPTSLAAVPSAANSTVPACVVLCPMGDIPFTVIVRDLANNPISGASVVLDFSRCPDSVFICPQKPSDPYLVNAGARTIRMFTDALGSVTFPARVGGVGPASCAAVFANGTLLGFRSFASPDQSGDGVVSGADLAVFTAKLGTSDETADFDCSGGSVNAADQAIFDHHFLHSCDGVVAVERRSWGSLKQHYR